MGLGINPILTYGSQAQKERFLPDLVAGRALAGFGLTEPDAGSDAGATRTKAVLTDGQWVVDGAKAFITNSGTDITSVVTVTARTGTGDDGRPEISAIMIPSGTPGFTVEAPYDKLGWNISDTHGLSFGGCRVPEDHLLGQRGHGFRQFLKTLDDGRIAISALALGLITRMREEATAYASTRTAFGRPIGVNQGVAFPIADLAVMEDTARLLTYRAAWLKDEQESGRRSVAEVEQAAAVAKLYTSEAAVSATRIATQVFGGNGFMEEYPVARFYRDAKILDAARCRRSGAPSTRPRLRRWVSRGHSRSRPSRRAVRRPDRMPRRRRGSRAEPRSRQRASGRRWDRWSRASKLPSPKLCELRPYTRPRAWLGAHEGGSRSLPEKRPRGFPRGLPIADTEVA